MKYKKENNEVLYISHHTQQLRKVNLQKLSDLADKNKDKKIRLCFHSSLEDKVHQMLIFHKKGYYIRPHKVNNRIETGLILNGECDLILFNKNGIFNKVVKLGSYNNKKNRAFFYIIPKNTFHTLIIHKDLIFLETTEGPFIKKDVTMANWAPSADDSQKLVNNYLKELKKNVVKI